MRTKHYDNVYIVQTEYKSKPYIKFEVYSKFFPKESDHLVTFWVPVSSKDKYGWIPFEILHSRCKHDGNFTFDHHGALHQMEK